MKHLGVLPVAGNHLAVDAKPGHHVAKLPVAVGGLVFVHEVHVDVVIGDFFVILGEQVEHGLAVFLKAPDPGFGGGEGVHPGDDPGAGGVGVGVAKHLADHVARDLGGQQLQREGQLT